MKIIGTLGSMEDVGIRSIQTLIFIIIIIVILFILIRDKFIYRKKLQELTESIVEKLFLPTKKVERKFLKSAITTLAIFVLFATIITGIPAVRDFLISRLFSDEFIADLNNNEDSIVYWIELISIFLEVLIVISFGGWIFTDSIASASQKSLNEYETERKKILNHDLEGLKEETRALARSLSSLVADISPKNFLPSIIEISKITFKIREHLLNELSVEYMNFMFISFYSNFPGGLYGLAAFNSLFILTALKVFMLFLESPLI